MRAAWICCALLALAPAAAKAQADYPSKPVHIIVGFGPGSAADLTARVVAQRLSATLGQQFIVENKPGGGSTVAAEQVSRAPKDGYTLLMGSVAIIINGLIQPSLKVNFAADFAPITMATGSGNILVVSPSIGVNNVAELIALAKTKPGQLNFGSSGFGTSPHMTGELFNIMAGTKIVNVHYQGSAQALADLLAGRIQVMFSPASTVTSHIESGTLKALATSEGKRNPALPNLPAVAETLPGFDTSLWFGFVAPAGTPQPIIDKLSGAINEALKNEEVAKPLRAAGLDIKGGAPAAFAAIIASETKVWDRVIGDAGLRKQ